MIVMYFALICAADFSKLCWNAMPHTEDPCTIMPNACPNGVCIRVSNSFRCDCNPGYRLDTAGSCVGTMMLECFGAINYKSK